MNRMEGEMTISISIGLQRTKRGSIPHPIGKAPFCYQSVKRFKEMYLSISFSILPNSYSVTFSFL